MPRKTNNLKTAVLRKLAGKPAAYSPASPQPPDGLAARTDAPPARDYNDIRPNQATVPVMLLAAIGLLAMMIPAIDTYLYFLAGVVVSLVALALTNRAAKFRFKKLMGSHQGQAKIILAANTNAVVNVDLSYPSFTHWDCVYVIDKTAIREEDGIATLYYYQSVPTPIVFPDMEVLHSAEKIMAAQKTHWTIARMIAANELWDLFKLIAIGVIVVGLLGVASAYLSYDAGNTCKAHIAYTEYVMNQTLAVANSTAKACIATVSPYATLP